MPHSKLELLSGVAPPPPPPPPGPPPGAPPRPPPPPPPGPVGRLGTETMERILALHTPLQQTTVGSGFRLSTHTCTHSLEFRHSNLDTVHLADVAVTVAHPHVLQVVGVEAERGHGAGELQ